MGTLAWSDPIRVRRSVHRPDGGHLGYVTTIDYPNRDITALAEGSPYREIVIADPRERHIALLQRYKAHWLVQCGRCYETADRGGDLDADQALKLADWVLEQHAGGRVTAIEIAAMIEEMLETPKRATST